MAKAIKLKKCSLKSCANNENGICQLSEFPYVFKNIVPSKIKCSLFDDNPEKTYAQVKQSGGVIGMILRKKRKRTDNDLQEIKKAKRKRRSDIGKKRGKRK